MTLLPEYYVLIATENDTEFGCHLHCADGDSGQREPEFSPPLYKGAENLATGV